MNEQTKCADQGRRAGALDRLAPERFTPSGRWSRRLAGEAKGENFCLRGQRKPLKNLDSDKRIQGNPNPFQIKISTIPEALQIYCLYWLGKAWRIRTSAWSAPLGVDIMKDWD